MTVQNLKQRSLLLLLGAAVASQVDAAASGVQARSNHNTLSTDGSCGRGFAGKGKGMHCPGSTCCSQWGWCGNGPEHCLVGCQSGFGRCDRTENHAGRPPFGLPWTGRKDRAPGGFRWRGPPGPPGGGRDHKGMDRYPGPPKHRYGRPGRGHRSDPEDSEYDSDSGSEEEYGRGRGRRGRGRHGKGRHGEGRRGKGRHSKGRHGGKGRHGHGKGYGGRSREWRGHSPHQFGRHRGPHDMNRSGNREGHWPSRGGRISRAWERFKGYRDWDDTDSDSEDEDAGRFLDKLKGLKFPPLFPPLGPFPPFPPFPPITPRPGPLPGVRPGPGIRPGAPPSDPAFANRTKPGKVPYGKIIKTCTQPGVVALTFDDGPSTFTGRLLDVLKNNGNVKATFFINGKNAGDLNDQPMKDAVKRMIADGHQVGSHGFSHKSLSPLPLKEKIVEMTKLEAVLKDVIGKMPTYMRPPNFECNDECLKLMTMLGYHVIHENLDTQDFKNTNTIQVSKDIVTKAVDAADSKKNNFIVYANEIHEATVDQLTKHMIEKFKEKGYKFVTVGECLGDPSENWYRM